MTKRTNDIINILVISFILYYMINNVFHIKLFNSPNSPNVSNVCKDDFMQTLIQSIKHKINIKENLVQNIVNQLPKNLLQTKLDKIISSPSKLDEMNASTMGKTRTVLSATEKNLKNDMISHLDSIIDNFEKNKKESSDKYINSNYIPDIKESSVLDYTTRPSSNTNKYVEMNLTNECQSNSQSNSLSTKPEMENTSFDTLNSNDINGYNSIDSDINNYSSL